MFSEIQVKKKSDKKEKRETYKKARKIFGEQIAALSIFIFGFS